jgi:iron-sulfur cluster assembly protein
MAITLTEKAATEVKRIIAEQKLDDGIMLRVGVAGGGCSGFAYSLGFDKAFDKKTDACHEHHGVQVVVDKMKALYLDGTTVDFFDDADRRGFTFDNPNTIRTCSCGH